MLNNGQVVELWDEVKDLVQSLEFDILKNANGNAAAGVRMRKGLRALRSKVSSLVKVSVELDKTRKTSPQS